MEVTYPNAAPEPLDLATICERQKLTASEKKSWNQAADKLQRLDAILVTLKQGGVSSDKAAFQAFWDDPSPATAEAWADARVRRDMGDRLVNKARPLTDKLRREADDLLRPVALAVVDRISEDLKAEAEQVRETINGMSNEIGLSLSTADLDGRLQRTLGSLAEERKRAESGHALEVLRTLIDLPDPAKKK